jgi:hypothetical protein
VKIADVQVAQLVVLVPYTATETCHAKIHLWARTKQHCQTKNKLHGCRPGAVRAELENQSKNASVFSIRIE